MKKMLMASLLTATAIATGSAAFAASGGYVGPQTNTVTVGEVMGLNDDTFVILKGNITQNLGDEMYVFTDGTGSINVEIDSDDWNGQNIGPNDVVIIKGDIDKNGNVVQVDVDEVALAN